MAVYRHLLRRLLDTDVDPIILRFWPHLAKIKLSARLSDEPLPRRIIVVDEFQSLLDSKSTKSLLIDGVKRLGSKARAAGIHLVLATQRPDAKSVPGEIKNNLAGRIALRVSEAVNSRIILDQAGDEELLGKGDFLANLGHGLVRGQSAMVRRGLS